MTHPIDRQISACIAALLDPAFVSSLDTYGRADEPPPVSKTCPGCGGVRTRYTRSDRSSARYVCVPCERARQRAVKKR